MPAAPTLFLAPTSALSRRAAWQFLCENEAVSPLDSPLVLSSPQNALAWRELSRQGASRQGASRQGAAKTQIAPRLIRAERYFARFHASNTRGRAVSGTDRLWVLRDVARRVAPKLGELENKAQNRDFLIGFSRWIGALHSAGLSPFPDGEHSPALNVLFHAYQMRLQSLNAFDAEAAPLLFSVSAPQNRAFDWPQLLLIDDCLDPSPALQIGLETLLSRARWVAATLICPGAVEAENPAVSRALRFWNERGARIVRVGESSSQTRAAARVLGAVTAPEIPPDVLLTAAHTPWDEMNRIAAHIRRDIENGAHPADFVVAPADFAAYEAVARHAFAAHGVPLDWPFAAPLRSVPLVRALLRASQACRGVWNVHELHDLFGDGTLCLQTEEKRFDARRLRAAALAARHTEMGDVEAARRAFDAKIEQLTRFPKLDEAARRARIEASIVAADLEFVAQFQALCGGFSGFLSATAWQNRWLQLIDALAGHWLELDPSRNRAARAAHAAIKRLKNAIEAVAARAKWGQSDDETDPAERSAAERSAADWHSWLELEIEAQSPLDEPLENARPGGVRVASLGALPEARRALFLCGLSEGAWPVSPSFGPLGARGRDIHHVLHAHDMAPIARATHLLACAIGESSLVSLSFPSFVGGKENPPSPLLDDLKAAFSQAKTWPQLEPGREDDATRRAHLTRWNRWLQYSPDSTSQENFQGIQENFQSIDENLQVQEEFRLKTLQRLRRERRDPKILGVYDGVLGSRGRLLMEEWSTLRGAAVLSVSALELYARCPLRFFFERVLDVIAEEEVDDDLDARAAGNLVHSIAHNFLKSCEMPLSGAIFEVALENLARCVREECEKLPIRPILREAEFHRLMGADGSSGPLPRWLRLEIGSGNGAWTSDLTPLSQSVHRLDGAGTGLEVRFDLEIGGERVKGFIDRLDIAPDGRQIAVLDYKTGDPSGLPSWKSGDRGLHFQLAIYALAARHLSRSLEISPRVAMAYISVRKAKITHGIGQDGTLGKGHSSGKSLPDDRFEAWLENVSQRVARIADLRRNGVFNIALQSAKDAKCDSCNSKTLCAQHEATQIERFEAHYSSPLVYLPEVWEWDDKTTL